MSDDSIQPIINHHKRKQTSGLERKQVSIVGTNDFSVTIDKEVANNNLPANDPRYKATTTMKISPVTNLKLQTLKPFINEQKSNERSDTMNDLINVLIESYIGKNLTARQANAYNQMFGLQLSMLKPKQK
ncbi:hypothetical protein D2U14_14015 [Lacticaseibacillus paracasei]|uniref:hypothetical protein n=1 Tax=Lacticaseibacillus paracasei TaxID=1597 RepID=UPI000E59F7F7|nr:hypothetical protein [Lacticaseibacillus paracasei]RHX71494.1 hypothetical protein D2U14_14015 [Lacticaseibacillus paracasei]